MRLALYVTSLVDLMRPAIGFASLRRLADGSYQLLDAEHIFRDYQFSVDHQILLPPE